MAPPNLPGKRKAAAHARAIAGRLSMKTTAAALTQVAAYFDRELSTLSGAVSALEEHSRNSKSSVNALNRDLYAI